MVRFLVWVWLGSDCVIVFLPTVPQSNLCKLLSSFVLQANWCQLLLLIVPQSNLHQFVLPSVPPSTLHQVDLPSFPLPVGLRYQKLFGWVWFLSLRQEEVLDVRREEVHDGQQRRR